MISMGKYIYETMKNNSCLFPDRLYGKFLFIVSLSIFQNFLFFTMLIWILCDKNTLKWVIYTLYVWRNCHVKKKRFDHALKKNNEFENIRKNGNHIQFTISNVKDSSDIIIKEDGLLVERKHCVLFVKAQYKLITVTFFDNNFFLLFLFRQSWNSVYICHH